MILPDANETIAGNDQVIEQFNTQNVTGNIELFGYLQVGQRRLQAARGMIVRNNDGCRTSLNGRVKYFSRVHNVARKTAY